MKGLLIHWTFILRESENYLPNMLSGGLISSHYMVSPEAVIVEIFWSILCLMWSATELVRSEFSFVLFIGFTALGLIVSHICK